VILSSVVDPVRELGLAGVVEPTVRSNHCVPGVVEPTVRSIRLQIVVVDLTVRRIR